MLAEAELEWLPAPLDFDELDAGYGFATLDFAYDELGLTVFSCSSCWDMFLWGKVPTETMKGWALL